MLPFNPNLPSAELQEELKRVRLDALVVPVDTAIPDWVMQWRWLRPLQGHEGDFIV